MIDSETKRVVPARLKRTRLAATGPNRSMEASADYGGITQEGDLADRAAAAPQPAANSGAASGGFFGLGCCTVDTASEQPLEAAPAGAAQPATADGVTAAAAAGARPAMPAAAQWCPHPSTVASGASNDRPNIAVMLF